MQTKKNKKSQKMTLKDYYDSLERETPPKQKFVEDIASKCSVQEQTVRSWIYGRAKPKEEWHIKVLEEITGIERSELWK
ncbi:MAG: hypothetical protein IJ759_06070 [Bacteroidales bacterium]|nr:hypothetical protein [Bacteroidales bacterium]